MPFRWVVAGLACLIALYGGSALAAEPRRVDFDDALFKAFTQRGISPNEVSLVAVPLEPYVRRRPLSFDHRGAELVNPASVIKLFTTGFAFDRLGTGYRFKTGFHAENEPSEGVLKGPLYVKGGGDPVFLTNDLWSSLRQLRTRGIDQIQGDVIVDRQVFQSRLKPAKEDDKDFDEAPHRAYHAEPDGLLMNHGAMLVSLEVIEGLVHLVPDGAPSSWAFVSEIDPVRGRCRSWKNGMEVRFEKVAANVVVTFSGNYPIRCGASTLPIRIPNQSWLFESWFRELWAQLGGSFKGEILEGETPADSEALYTHRGPMLSEIVRSVNKWSSNVMARHLELASIEDAGDFNLQILSWLNEAQVNTRGWFFENGSGLARQTRVDGRGLTQFLVYMASRADFPDFLASLPRAGYDGTLSRKFRNIDHFAYLKTGSLSGVRTAAGYVRAQSGQWYAIAMAVESAKAYNAWPGLESVVRYIYSKQ